MNKEQQIAEIAEILKNSATESAKYFQREIKKAFKSGAKQLKRSDCEKSIHDIAAEALYNAGYRKTFTSDFASDTQKAYKESYIKGIEETEAEIEILKIQNKNRGYQPLPITLKPAPPKGLTPSPKSISIDTVKEMNAMCNIDEQRKQVVREFAERVKNAFYAEFDEIIPSIMANKIDELLALKKLKELKRNT